MFGRYNPVVLTPLDETICALATPPGRGGIGVIRVSGPEAFAVVDRITVRPRGRSCRSYRGHTLHRAVVTDCEGAPIDDVLLAIFHNPASYTGDDTVEISCHGGPIPLRLTLERLLAQGARAAGPGEFTRRAYVNGKMDLAQAEAVADLINAQTDLAHRYAVSQQSGRLSASVTEIRDIVLGVLARIEASIDFPEDVGELDDAACDAELADAAARLDILLDTADRGMLAREGLSVVLAGRPNVGKSSLLNALLRTSRAIVTPIPGTTRDTLEETANIAGIPVRLTDTAGVRETGDVVEQEGVKRSLSTLDRADLVLLVRDASTGLDSEDIALERRAAASPHLIVWNKCDLKQPPADGLGVSAATGQGIEALEQAIVALAAGGDFRDAGAAVVTHSRHRNALAAAREQIAASRETIARRMPPDFISIDVRGALVSLGEITGETATDDIINEIFSRFCIGK